MDKTKLVEILRKHGLDIAEDAATMIIKGVFKALPEIFTLTENKFDDIAIPLLGVLEAPLLAAIDKIDGQVG